MKCNECHKKIPKGDEIQTEGSIVCEDCSLIKCSRCNWGVTKRELAEENSGIKTFSIFFISGTPKLKLTLCNGCYKQGSTEKEKAEKGGKQNKWLIGGAEFLLFVLTMSLFYLKFILFGVITLLLLAFLFGSFQIIGPICIELRKYTLRERNKPANHQGKYSHFTFTLLIGGVIIIAIGLIILTKNKKG